MTKSGVLLAATIVAVISIVGSATPERSIHDEMAKTLAEKERSLIDLRRDLHRFPERSGDEVRTSAIVAARMKDAGLEVRTDVGGHGVVAVLEGGRPGPVVAYRADMDAIPSPGPDPVPFSSEDPSLRHGCGHDVHVTIAVGIAETMARYRDEMQGTVVFIFQPAEETAEGAAAVIKDGALKHPKPGAIFAVHSAPLEVGTIGTRPGMLLAGLDVAEITLKGRGNIRAAQERVAAVFAGINTVEPSEGAGIEGGGDFTAAGIFESYPTGAGATVQAMVRASSEERHQQAQKAVRAGIDGIDVPDVSHHLEYRAYAIPPVMNDPALVAETDAVIVRLRGPNALVPIEGVTPFFSEDFSHYQEKIPGVLYFLGVSNSEKGIVGLPHTPSFVVDEGAIVFGAGVMASVLWDYLEQH